MLRGSTQMVVILYLLRWAVSLDADKNLSSPYFTTEATKVVDCFSKAVETSWQFQDEEDPWVLIFEDITTKLCDRRLWRTFKCNYSLMEQLQESKTLRASSVRKEHEFYNTNKLEHYENSVKLQGKAVHVLEELILLIHEIKLVADARNETRIFSDNCSILFLGMDTLKNKSTDLATEHLKLQIRLEILQIKEDIMWYYLPPFVTTVFISGMFGNGMLLLIFVRHPETRAGPNAMLVNLAISDTLFLFSNVALDYCKQLWGFPLGVTACYFYTFLLTLITGGCVYSMMILSLSRYLAVTAKPGKRSSVFLSSTPVMLSLVWILSSIVAIPDTLSTHMVFEINNVCRADNHMLNALCDFFFISLIPLAAITCFYVAASRRLIESARNMPGEAVGQVKVKTARERGAKILPALAFVFAITYLPFYTLWATITVFAIDTNECPNCHRLFHLGYFLFNLNSTLNPLALYAASSMFRKYFNQYLCPRFVKKQPPKKTEIKLRGLTSGV